MKDTLVQQTSRLQGFYSVSADQRLSLSATAQDIQSKQLRGLNNFGILNEDLVETFIENGVGTFSLPLGIATNFKINNHDLLIPMAIEESSVIAAASYGAKLARHTGGFKASSSEPIMTGQVQIFVEQNTDFDYILSEKKQDLLELANHSFERLCARGGGAKDISWYYLDELKCVVINLHIHTGNAMGANIVNSMCETISHPVAKLLNGKIGLQILTNLCHKRTAQAECKISRELFGEKRVNGQSVTERIAMAHQFAEADHYRAATHNKGVMNGIDAVVIATGNDWRAVEAGAHAHCVQDGKYRPMTSWKLTENGDLLGKIQLPIAVGTVGGVTKLHPTAQSALKLLGNPTSQELAQIMCCVGLAQNLSALKALGVEGIQQGHMSLHRKNLEMLNKLQ